MESNGNGNKFVDESGVSKGKSNLDVGLTKSFRWNEMNIKGLEWKAKLRAIKYP